MTIEELAEQYAKEYAHTIYGPTDALGQCVHPTLGRSDYIMRHIFNMVGYEQGKRLIDLEMKKMHNRRYGG